MTARWLAAVLNPRDVAPTPDAIRSNRPDQEGLLALLASARFDEYARVTGGYSIPLGNEEPVTPGRLVSSVAAALRPGDQVDALAQLASLIQYSTADRDERVAGALFAAVLCGEADDNQQAISILSNVLESLPTPTSVSASDGELLKLAVSALLIQRARRRYDLGLGSGLEDADFAAATLNELEPDRIGAFSLAAGVQRKSHETVKQIVISLRYSAEAHCSNLSPQTSEAGSHRLFTREQTRLALRADNRGLSGYSEHEGAVFRDALGSNSAWSRGTSAGDESLRCALYFYEFYGSPETIEWRRRLGIHSFIQSIRSDEDNEDRVDSLRLLRRGNDRRRLSSVIEHTRTNGPLSALQTEVTAIIRSRPNAEVMRLAELSMLAGAGTLLTEAQANQLLGEVLRRTRYRLPQIGTSWSAEGIIQEEVWGAALSVAIAAGRLDRFVVAMLDQILGSSATATDELTDRALAKTLRKLSWNDVDQESKQSWLAWLESRSVDLYPIVAEIVSPSLTGSYLSSNRPIGAQSIDKVNLSSIGDQINESLVHGREFPASSAAEAQQLLIAEMQRISEDAETGSRSLGHPQPCELAVALSHIIADPDDLWEEICRFLIHPLVARGDKDDAFERIARFPEDVPRQLIGKFAESSRSLLDESFDIFDNSLIPYPAALRALAAVEALESSSLLGEVARLSGTNDVLAHVEAARTVTSIARSSSPPQWAFVLALQLSLDSEVGARAEAGRALTLLWSKFPAQQSLIGERIRTLLDTDSVMTPLLLMRGLREATIDLPSFLIDKIQEIAGGHKDCQIRRIASDLLSAE